MIILKEAQHQHVLASPVQGDPAPGWISQLKEYYSPLPRENCSKPLKPDTELNAENLLEEATIKLTQQHVTA